MVYLAFYDLFYSISHTCDHVFMLTIKDHPPHVPCIIMALFLGEFIFGQYILVTFTAVNSFLMVVHEKKIRLGLNDWKLILFTLGGPVGILVPLATLKLLGPSGSW